MDVVLLKSNIFCMLLASKMFVVDDVEILLILCMLFLFYGMTKIRWNAICKQKFNNWFHLIFGMRIAFRHKNLV